jgi:hypothetical protein
VHDLRVNLSGRDPGSTKGETLPRDERAPKRISFREIFVHAALEPLTIIP